MPPSVGRREYIILVKQGFSRRRKSEGINNDAESIRSLRLSRTRIDTSTFRSSLLVRFRHTDRMGVRLLPRTSGSLATSVSSPSVRLEKEIYANFENLQPSYNMRKSRDKKRAIRYFDFEYLLFARRGIRVSPLLFNFLSVITFLRDLQRYKTDILFASKAREIDSPLDSRMSSYK